MLDDTRDWSGLDEDRHGVDSFIKWSKDDVKMESSSGVEASLSEDEYVQTL